MTTYANVSIVHDTFILKKYHTFNTTIQSIKEKATISTN